MRQLIAKITSSDWFIMAVVLVLAVFTYGWVFSPALGRINGIVTSAIGIGILAAALFCRTIKRKGTRE